MSNQMTSPLIVFVVATVILVLLWIGYKLLSAYEKSISGLIVHGNYNTVRGRENAKKFPDEGPGKARSELAYLDHKFDYHYTDEDILRAVEAKGYRMASLREYLTFVAENPGEIRKYPIITFAHEVASDGKRCYADTLYFDFRSDLLLDRYNAPHHWFGPNYRFLIAPK